MRWVRTALRNSLIFHPTISTRSCFHKFCKCDFDNNFAAISNEFIDTCTTQFGNPGINVILTRILSVKLKDFLEFGYDRFILVV